jgi:predicted enzyme related to lactoylglutathione lyase
MADKNHKTPWISSIPVVVSDREAAKEWYVNKFGLNLTSNEEHWVTVGSDEKGTQIHLCQASENQPEPIPMEPGPSGIVFVLPGDFLTECKRLKERGVEFSHEPEKAPWGWFATVIDPDGNEHHLAPSS